MSIFYTILIILNIFFAGWDFADYTRTFDKSKLAGCLVCGIASILLLIGHIVENPL